MRARVIVAGMGWQKHVALFGVSLVGCYEPPASEERFEDSVVVTSRDGAANFEAFQTFFIRPDVRVLAENLDGSVPVDVETLPAEQAQPLIEQTQLNLIARGYQPAASKEEADLAVELNYLRAIYSEYYCYYWADWYYWGYPGYYYDYPYSCDTAAWRSGMVVTNIVDLMSAGPPVEPGPSTNALLRGVWFSGVYGVETGTTEFIVDRSVAGIDQAFEQSPYLASGSLGGLQ